MNPELLQSCALFVYSFLLFLIGLTIWMRKRKRLYALENVEPCPIYLKMRLEVAKQFDKNEYSRSTFEDLRLDIRYFNSMYLLFQFVDILAE